MTQPIQEPSTDRALQGFAYARDQIFRRPAPISGTGLSVFRAYRFQTPITVSGSGTSTPVRWDTWENCNTDVFDVNLTLGLVSSVEVLVAGRVAITWGIKFDDPSAITDSVAMILVDNEPVWGPNQYFTVHGRLNSGAEQFEETGIYIQTFIRSYPTLDIFDSGDQFPIQFSFEASTLVGTSEDVDFAFLDISHEAADICTGPVES